MGCSYLSSFEFFPENRLGFIKVWARVIFRTSWVVHHNSKTMCSILPRCPR